MSPKIAIIYYSATGTNYQLAQWALEGAKDGGAEVRIAKIKETAPQEAIDTNPAWRRNLDETKGIPDATLDDLEWADGIIFSSPTRYGSAASQLRQFLDTTGGLWKEGKLANKTVTAMSSASNPHGGQEQTILDLYATMFHWGCIIVAPGYTDPVIFKAGGNPYGTSVSVDEKGNMKEDVKGAVLYQAKRLVSVTEQFLRGIEVPVSEFNP